MNWVASKTSLVGFFVRIENQFSVLFYSRTISGHNRPLQRISIKWPVDNLTHCRPVTMIFFSLPSFVLLYESASMHRENFLHKSIEHFINGTPGVTVASLLLFLANRSSTVSSAAPFNFSRGEQQRQVDTRGHWLLVRDQVQSTKKNHRVLLTSLT